MVLDRVERAAKALARKCLSEEFRNSLAAAAVAQPLEHQADIGRMGDRITDLAQVKDRTQPTWIASTTRDAVTEAVLFDRMDRIIWI